jgi:hypothetical protein
MLSFCNNKHFNDKINNLSEFSINQLENFVNKLKDIEEKEKFGKTFSYNFRYDHDYKSLWQPMLQNIINDYKVKCETTMINPEYDLIYRSRYSSNIKIETSFIQIFADPQKIVVSDYIMFNKNYKLKR